MAAQGSNARAGSPRTAARVPAARLRAAQAAQPPARLEPAAVLRLALPGAEADAARRLDHREVVRHRRLSARASGSSTRSRPRAASTSPRRSPRPVPPPGRTTTSTSGSRSSPAPTLDVRLRILEGRRSRLQERLDRVRAASHSGADRYAAELQRHGVESVEREVTLAHRPDRRRAPGARPSPRPRCDPAPHQIVS